MCFYIWSIFYFSHPLGDDMSKRYLFIFSGCLFVDVFLNQISRRLLMDMVCWPRRHTRGNRWRSGPSAWCPRSWDESGHQLLISSEQDEIKASFTSLLVSPSPASFARLPFFLCTIFTLWLHQKESTAWLCLFAAFVRVSPWLHMLCCHPLLAAFSHSQPPLSNSCANAQTHKRTHRHTPLCSHTAILHNSNSGCIPPPLLSTWCVSSFLPPPCTLFFSSAIPAFPPYRHVRHLELSHFTMLPLSVFPFSPHHPCPFASFSFTCPNGSLFTASRPFSISDPNIFYNPRKMRKRCRPRCLSPGRDIKPCQYLCARSLQAAWLTGDESSKLNLRATGSYMNTLRTNHSGGGALHVAIKRGQEQFWQFIVIEWKVIFGPLKIAFRKSYISLKDDVQEDGLEWLVWGIRLVLLLKH